MKVEEGYSDGGCRVCRVHLLNATPEGQMKQRLLTSPRHVAGGGGVGMCMRRYAHVGAASPYQPEARSWGGRGGVHIHARVCVCVCAQACMCRYACACTRASICTCGWHAPREQQPSKRCHTCICIHAYAHVAGMHRGSSSRASDATRHALETCAYAQQGMRACA